MGNSERISIDSLKMKSQVDFQQKDFSLIILWLIYKMFLLYLK
jgi:hypothetical protein